MAKSADAFRTISEVADWLETPAHVLRFWESKFSQVKPVKRAGGRRYYRPADMKLLGGIKKLLHDDGMTIKGVQKMLREQGVAYVSDFSQPLGDAADDVLISRAEEAASTDVTSDPTDTKSPAPRSEPPAPPTAPEPAVETANDPEPAATDDEATPPLTFSRRANEEPSEEKPQVEEASAPTENDSPALPSFLHRREVSDEAPQEAQPESSDTEDTAAPPTPEIKPAVVDIPDDPEDSIAADPGVLSQLSRLSRPLPPVMAKQLATLVAKLRATTGSTVND